MQLNKCWNNRNSYCTTCNSDYYTWRTNNLLCRRICYFNIFCSFRKYLVYGRNNEFNYGFNFRILYGKCGIGKLHGNQFTDYNHGKSNPGGNDHSGWANFILCRRFCYINIICGR